MGINDSIYNGYRNDLWYEHYLKGKTAEEAYDLIIENLKIPTFVYEKDCAVRVYEKLFGKFMSADKRKIESQNSENEMLKKRIAELEARERAVPVDRELEPDPVMPEEVKEQEPSILFEQFPKGMSKETFKVFYSGWYEKSQGIKPTGLAWGRAWKRYQVLVEGKEDEKPA